MPLQKLNHIQNALARRAQRYADCWAKQYWHANPFGGALRADKIRYEALWEEEKQSLYPKIDGYEDQTGFAVDKTWLDNLALHTQIVIKDSPLCYQHGRVVYSALSEYLQNFDALQNGPCTIVETGTARGFSALCMAKALQDQKKTGQILTFDLLPHRTKMYWNCIDDHEGQKSREELLSPWNDLLGSIAFVEGDSRIFLEKIALNRIHFAFLDGAHTYRDVMLEFDLVRRRQQQGDRIVFDDYSDNVFAGLVRAVDEGCEKWGYDKTVLRTNDQRAYVIAVKK